MGSGDYPVFTDERTPTEVEASLVLGKIKRKVNGSPWVAPQNVPSCVPNAPLTCRDTCQGQEPGTASSPLTILARPVSTGWMAGTPQPGG